MKPRPLEVLLYSLYGIITVGLLCLAAYVYKADVYASEMPVPLHSAPLSLAQKIAFQSLGAQRDAISKQIDALGAETCKNNLHLADAQVKDCRVAGDLSTVNWGEEKK